MEWPPAADETGQSRTNTHMKDTNNILPSNTSNPLPCNTRNPLPYNKTKIQALALQIKRTGEAIAATMDINMVTERRPLKVDRGLRLLRAHRWDLRKEYKELVKSTRARREIGPEPETLPTIQRIEITAAELADGQFRRRFRSVDDFDRELEMIADWRDESGEDRYTYTKVFFKIILTDGSSYTGGRIDVRNSSRFQENESGEISLVEHVLHNLRGQMDGAWGTMDLDEVYRWEEVLLRSQHPIAV